MTFMYLLLSDTLESKGFESAMNKCRELYMYDLKVSKMYSHIPPRSTSPGKIKTLFL